MSVNLIILLVVLALAIFLFFDWVVKTPERHAEHQQLMKDLDRAHYDAVNMLRELREDDMRKLYPIGSLIPRRKKLTDDTGPK